MYYRHHKGGIYNLLHKTNSLNGSVIKTLSDIVATHTESGKDVHVWIHDNKAFTVDGEYAIYTDKNSKVWARPKKMFFENITLNGERVRRFQPIIGVDF